jgi:uncharacterized protein
MRTLIIIIVLALIIVIAKRLWQTPRPPKKSSREAGKMAQCAHCGIFIPEQEALRRGEHCYCSQAHLDKDLHNKS